tara:strand:- start:152 stop:664 length:513 start_codon:yes stop_codon:yes gene_type:complete
MNGLALKYFDVRAAIIFIVAHLITACIYIVIVNNSDIIWQSGFTLHMLQALVYLSIMYLKLGFKLKVAALITSVFYVLIAVNWLLFQREIETQIQTYFYDHFESIIMTIDLIVIYLLGKGGGIHLFDMFFKRHSFFSKLQLFFRSGYINSVCNINLSISNPNIKSKEVSK